MLACFVVPQYMPQAWLVLTESLAGCAMEVAPPGFVVKRGARNTLGSAPSGDLGRATSLQAPAAAASGAQPPAATTAASASTSAPQQQEDAPIGFPTSAPPASASVAALLRRSEWFYVDPAGEEHGPVPLSKVAGWHRKGHFTDDVKVGTHSA